MNENFIFQPVVKALNKALYHVGLEHPRCRPELDLSPVVFMPDDYFLQYGYFLPPKEAETPLILPDSVKEGLGAAPALILPEGL